MQHGHALQYICICIYIIKVRHPSSQFGNVAKPANKMHRFPSTQHRFYFSATFNEPLFAIAQVPSSSQYALWTTVHTIHDNKYHPHTDRVAFIQAKTSTRLVAETPIVRPSSDLCFSSCFLNAHYFSQHAIADNNQHLPALALISCLCSTCNFVPQPHATV